ncbi:ShlB/FhaC/HecB family hemolysin secretion/activation protein [Polaribacter sp. Hel1_85]|uniref:ShlB/FhaC/HecB family hemolysin secretion/activation protein n=1 Tax=Polaribacter sp. Hel1_85 TaxID=1250005 RepID=UPI00052CF910|nr:ShlB/FhaC/HecB family hemolysin secretion/activation protein [Polaribacter sp. Hel1_85]KGL62834.1 hypothetical protein PHEL85_2630 [Polaribacter sp. Hel1_85]
MKQKHSHYIYIIFLIFSFKGIIAQDLTLKITSNNKEELIILNEIDYQKKHKDTISINKEIEKVSDYLKKTGYLTNTVNQIKKNDKKHIAYFFLNNKIETAVIILNTKSEVHFDKSKIKNGTISIPLKELQTTLLNISKKYDKQGKSFTKIQLKNIEIKNKTLFAHLDIKQSKKRSINKVIIKGYENFPKSYLKNYYRLNSKTIFNQQKIKEISKASKGLQFIKEIKPPEVLFTKDSTLLYMYLKKQQNNSFDGIVSFASKENGDVLFNGNIDLSINNILDTAEKIQLFWNSIGEEKQEFKLTTETPYIFNTKFSPQLAFSIYKQDSTFLNTKFDSKLFYSINPNTKLGFTYNSESSENLEKELNNNVKTFSNYFLGLQFQFNKPKNDFFFNDKFHLEVNPTFGRRKSDENTSNQFKIEASTSYLWVLNLRNSIYIKNKTGYLNSDSFIDNELFRIGGSNSIRGFNEQSIFASNYSYFNLEYRYLTSEKSYLYSITDISHIKTTFNTEKLLGIGLGYLFNTNNSQINLNVSAGKKTTQSIDLKNVKLTVNWVNYF